MDSQSLTATEALSAKGATAPRVSLADINDAVALEASFTIGDAMQAMNDAGSADFPAHRSLELLTVSVLVMKNGFVVIGKSAPASPENFDAEKGRTFARDDAIRQLWPLLGFSLRDRLAA